MANLSMEQRGESVFLWGIRCDPVLALKCPVETASLKWLTAQDRAGSVETEACSRHKTASRSTERRIMVATKIHNSDRSIKAYIYQDSKQLPLLTTSTLFSHSLRCIRAKRRGEAAFNAIYTWRHNSIKRPCFVKETGIDMIILAGVESLCSAPMSSSFAVQTQHEALLTQSPCASTFLFKLTIYEERKGSPRKQLPL